jgi:hypothetical protein
VRDGGGDKAALLEYGVDGGNSRCDVLLLPFAVAVARSALGNVVEKPLVLGIVESSGQAGRDALMTTQQRVSNGSLCF